MAEWTPCSEDFFYVQAKPKVLLVESPGPFGCPVITKETKQDYSYSDAVFEVVASDYHMVVAKQVGGGYVADRNRQYFFPVAQYKFFAVSPEVIAACVKKGVK